MPEISPKLSKTHPVPQHIAAFEFKLIGDLTIKQFLSAGVGIAVAYAAWISDLNFFVKWGTILLSAGLGLGTAFFPIKDRTLDQWIINFISAIFSPTQRIWHKEPLPPEYLREDYSQFLASQVLSMTPIQSRRKLQQYLKWFEDTKVPIEEEEEEFIERLNFDVPPSITGPKRPREAKESEIKLPDRRELPTEPKLASEINIALEKTYKVPTEKETKHVTALRNITPGRKIRLPTVEGTIRLKPKEEPRPLLERKIAPPKPKPPGDGRTEQLQRQNLELKTRLEQAEAQLKSLTEIKKELGPKEAYRERLLGQEKLVRKLSERQRETQKKISKTEPTLVIDKKIPNLVSGIVKDKEGKLLENIVVIIKDQDDDPVRALKTNRLGQFAISTPLENGDYAVEISNKERYFDIMKVAADGSVLASIEFREKHG